MSHSKLFVCRVCGNIVMRIHDGGGTLTCCGQPMEELVPNTVDAAKEKHVPVIEQKAGSVTVKVGSVAHPMTAEHLIQWIYLHTTNGGQYKCLTPNDLPQAVFALPEGEAPVAAYAYCNLHGLWKTEL